MILRFLRVTWFHFYDELARNLLVNFLALVAFVFPLPAIGIPVSLCAICGYANRLVRFQDPEWGSFFGEYKRWFGKGLLYGWTYFAMFVPLVFSFRFYVSRSEDLGLVAYGLAGVCFWAVVFYSAMGFYFFPLLVHQREGMVTTMKRAAAAVLIRPGLVASAGISVLLWGLICWLIQPLLFIVPLIWFAISGNVGLLLLLDEYNDEVPEV